MEEDTSHELTANTWRLTILVLVNILGACTLLMSAHHLFMTVFHLEDTVCTPEKRFKLTALFILDFCVAILSIIGLTSLLGGWLELCQ